MPTLRAMIDNKTYHAAGIAPAIAPAAGNSTAAGSPSMGNPPPKGKAGKSKGSDSSLSPAAAHITSHLSDPLGATKKGFQQLTQAKLEYDQQRENMQRELAMPQAVINHLSQIHGIMPGQPAGQTPTPGMTQNQPPGQIDPNTGQPMQAQPGQDPNNPGMNDDPDMDPQSNNPANMSQTVGKMNQSRPSKAGFQPGVSPGPQESVRPGKMGMPQPGGAQNMQYNKTAAPPKGNRSLPGAKGPGDPKVGNRTKKAQDNSSRQIKVHVSASTSSMPVIRASRTLETQFGLAMLRAAGTPQGAKKRLSTRGRGHLSKTEKAAHYKTMDSESMTLPMGSSPSMHVGNRSGFNRPSGAGRLEAHKKKMKTGAAQLSDKVSDSPDTELSYNPVHAGGPGSGRRPGVGSGSFKKKSMLRQVNYKNMDPASKRRWDDSHSKNPTGKGGIMDWARGTVQLPK
jgi:hypothetical protein